MTDSTGTGSPRTDPRLLARHIAERRVQLGLSENALATRAGMSPRYLQQLLAAGPEFDPGGLDRIATSLDLTDQELLAGHADPPPGRTGPGSRPVPARLTTAECWDRLATRGVGRVALPARPGPAVFPVNYAVDAGTIVYRTAPRGSAAPESGATLSFEVDRVDDRVSEGWSVLVTGTAEHIDDPATTRHLVGLHAGQPWAGGSRHLWIRIRPGTVSGRRIAPV